MGKFRNLLDIKYYNDPSVFKPENLLRVGRRQKGIPKGEVPEICILDPDGDILRYLKKQERANLNKCWACSIAQQEGDFEKGEEFGGIDSLRVSTIIAKRLRFHGWVNMGTEFGLDLRLGKLPVKNTSV